MKTTLKIILTLVILLVIFFTWRLLTNGVSSEVELMLGVFSVFASFILADFSINKLVK